VLAKVGYSLVAMANRIDPPPPPEPTPKELAGAAWRQMKGDETLRMNYPLDRDSVVLDLGGYKGQWSSDIFSRYLCRIHIFEPQPDHANKIAQRFAKNDLIKLHPFAIGAEQGEADLSVAGDGSSLYLPGVHRILVQVSTIETVLNSEGIDEVALMKVNIEGGEYDLLEGLTSNGLIRRIRNLQVQFHDFVPNAQVRMEAIQRRLQRTHRLTYQYPFIWESWERLAEGQ
jgi:FkbM family methyltransferase